jgi:peptide/nickel transport system ATP-binding protein
VKEPLLAIERLSVETVTGGVPIVRDVSLRVEPGEILSLIGESGSGKTTLALAALGHVRPGLHISAGRVRLNGLDILTLPTSTLRGLRGRSVAYVAQSAAASFNPAMRVGDQVIEPAMVHRLMSATKARARALRLFRQLALPEPEAIGRRYPHQVSGGQLQRLMAAMAMCCGPDLLVLDEPTTALDVTTQMGVLKSFKDAIREEGAAAIYISHDLAVVAQLADRILVLRGGEVQEEGPTEQILNCPTSPYTGMLIDACNRWVPGRVASSGRKDNSSPNLLEVRGVTAGYGRIRAGLPEIVAVKSVDLSIRRSSVVGVIGESGSGKSTVARVIAGLLPPAAGRLILSGKPLAPLVAHRSKEDLKRVQIVFQSPDVALNPAHRVEFLIGRPLQYFRGLSGRDKAVEIARLLEVVQLPPEMAKRRPHELSGGQKQRVNLARALAAEPELILCDEITSALDSLIAASIIDLLRDLRARHGLAYLFITHDVSTVATFADELMVMYRGEIVERGPTDEVLNRPQHPYTKVLVSSVPQLHTGWLETAIDSRNEVLKLARHVELAD